METNRAATRRHAAAQPARPLMGDRATPRPRRARHRLLAHPPLRHRPLPHPADRHQPPTPPITAAELDVADGHAYLDLPPFREIKPDVSLELRIPSLRLTFDLLVELDLTARPSYNHDKLRAYDAFLTGWALAHPRYRALATRPVTVFVCRDQHSALACAKEADRILAGRTGPMGVAARDWYFAGRQHIFFTAEPDIYHDSLRAFALPSCPPEERTHTGREDRLAIRPI